MIHTICIMHSKMRNNDEWHQYIVGRRVVGLDWPVNVHQGITLNTWTTINLKTLQGLE